MEKKKRKGEGEEKVAEEGARRRIATTTRERPKRIDAERHLAIPER